MTSRFNPAKRLLGTALAAACMLGSFGAYAQAPGSSKNVCLEAHLVQSTEIVDSSTILFHMTNGKTWKNTLTAPCRTMSKPDTIIYSPTNDKVCSNLETIRIAQTGEACLLGEFTPA